MSLVYFYHFAHFRMPYAQITQSLEIYQKSVFGPTLEAHMEIKEWFARVVPARDLLSDLRAL
jgi:hypothetical protein